MLFWVYSLRTSPVLFALFAGAISRVKQQTSDPEGSYLTLLALILNTHALLSFPLSLRKFRTGTSAHDQNTRIVHDSGSIYPET